VTPARCRKENTTERKVTAVGKPQKKKKKMNKKSRKENTNKKRMQVKTERIKGAYE